MEYNDYNDYELMSYVAEGNEDASDILIEKYIPYVNSVAGRMIKYCKNNGIDYSDLRQEGLIGLTEAINKFTELKGTSVYTYVTRCIDRKIISTVVKANRQKHRALNESISYDDEDNLIDKILRDDTYNPEDIILSSEKEDKLIYIIKGRLTDFEDQVFQLMLANFNYKEIAEILEMEYKAVDNAIQRIRIKVKEILKNMN